MPNFLTSRSSYEDHSVKDDGKSDMRPLQNLPPSQFPPIHTLRRMNIFGEKMPLEVTV